MPTYGYECTRCENQFEVMQSIKDDPLTTCETCGGTLRKRIYPVGIAFKGSGFYVNDYAAKPAGGTGSAPAADTGAAPAEPKSETVPTETPKADAPKTETKTPAAASGR